MFHKKKEPWKRLRWITLDDKKFSDLLDRVKSYINGMEKFLEQTKQQKRDWHLELCFREAILNAKVQQKLCIIGTEYGKAPSKPAIFAIARLKQTRLKLGVSDLARDSAATRLSISRSANLLHDSRNPTVSNTSNPGPKIMKLSMRRLTLSRSARAQPFRTLAQYDDRMVLLEWKNLTSMTDLVISRRVDQVATLLQDLGPSFYTLQCRGFVEDRVTKRYGYISDLPDELSSSARACRPVSRDICVKEPEPEPELRSLRQILDHSSMPSLNRRLSLAVMLLENLLNLHTSGWLHKDFRSDNVILVRKTDPTYENTSDELSLYSVYIAGYIHSRVDNPGEMTEPLNSEVEADLYRHPSLLYDSRQSYHKSLDIFGLGCTLLEIGLWSSFGRSLEHHSSARPDTVVPLSSARSMLEEIRLYSSSTDQTDDEAKNNKQPLLDLMRLRYDLLLSQFATDRPELTSPTTSKRSVMMVSLEAAMGNRYTGVVEECLVVGNNVDEADFNEHEYALGLEMRARDTVRALAGVV